MGRLVFTATCSLDLRSTDEHGDFGWAEPSDEVHAFVNDLERPVRTYLYGRRMWETMRFWETMPEEESVMGDYGRLWRQADKVVVSTSLNAVDTARTRVVRDLEPEVVRRLVAESATDVSIGGADLAGQALAAGLVDEIRLLVVPVVIGSGPRVLPDGLRTGLELRGSRTFDAGWTFLRYGIG